MHTLAAWSLNCATVVLVAVGQQDQVLKAVAAASYLEPCSEGTETENRTFDKNVAMMNWGFECFCCCCCYSSRQWVVVT